MADLSTKTKQDIRHAANIIQSSKHVVVLTGAGISTPSGIPDFRSPDSGLWERCDPFEVASLYTFRINPEKFFAWMRPLAIQIYDAQPNPAHRGLAHLEQAGYLNTIITQNIDNLHQRAASTNVLEVHGSMQTLTCVSCFQQVDSAGHIQPYFKDGIIPRCPDCDNLLKPDVVLIGEQMPVKTWLKAQKACKECDLMIMAGSSLEVIPVAGLPMLAIENGASLIIINHTNTYIDEHADIVFSEDVAEIIPLIVAEVLSD